MSRRSRRSARSLSVEALESRRLLAGDLCHNETSAALVPALAASAAPSGEIAAQNFAAADAGSTRSTAAKIGSVDGTVNLSGRLSFFDRIDTIGFTIERDADVRVELSRLNRDADLYFFDSDGNLLARSMRAGRNADSVALRLDAGEYFVAVQAYDFGSIRYRLSISADLDPVPAPEPVAPNPGTPNPPAADPPTQTPGTPDPPATGNPAPQPLADVAYFGGGRDWNLNAVGAPEAWAAGYTGAGVTVAVLDTGVDLDHPDLVDSLYVNPGEIAGNGIDDDGNGYVDDVHGYDFASRDSNPNDVGGHGTHVAGTIAAANNGFGATGVAPDATILPVRVLGSNGYGSSLDVAAGIRYAADLGADIINLSLGGGYSRAIDMAIDYARGLGSFVVAAAGNEASGVPGYPARFSATDDNVISVGAHNSANRLAGFSNDVGNSRAVQVDAPGVGIFSTYVGGRYATLSGTSMAAPHVAGLAALTLSSNPNLTSRQLRDLLTSGTVGQAVGSDAVGKVAAATTVAYAAAGLTVAPQTGAGGAGLAASGNALRMRASGVVAPVRPIETRQAVSFVVESATVEAPTSPAGKIAATDFVIAGVSYEGSQQDSSESLRPSEASRALVSSVDSGDFERTVG